MTMGMFFWVKKVVPALIVAADGSGDYATIQAAIDALPATGGEVFVKAGTYTITAVINLSKSNVLITGTGFSTKIVTTSNVPMIDLGKDAAVTRCVLSNLYFYGSGALNVGNHGVVIEDGTYCRVVDCYIQNCGGEGVLIQDVGTTNNVFRNCDISNNFRGGVSITEASDNLFANNTINNNTNSGIFIGIAFATSDNNIIINNIINSNGLVGVSLNVAAVNSTIIQGNTIIGNTVAPIVDNGTDTQIGHNVTT